MKIRELHLNDWMVIKQADFEDLSDFVVIAGPNGVGKTKIKDAIVYIFQNNGNPPPGCRVILEATNEEEKTAWGREQLVLPQPNFWQFFQRNNKRLKTKSRLIQIDSNRVVESVAFQQLTFQSIGNPEEEEVGYSYGFNNVKDRFADICRTLHRLKSKEVTSVYQEYRSNLDPKKTDVSLTKLQDPTARYIEMFGKLLYPKEMLPIDINSSTIQYKDDDGNIRQFSELSSGEREVVILTFDILAQNPSDCLILVDEPEVHLHPELTFRLIKALKSIGETNQYFLFTHSPDIIGNSLDTGVHFIRPKIRVPLGNQVIRIDESNVDAFKSIPNIRETIGMISVGKKLLFVEGNSTSIDRNVFATLAKSSKVDVAIVPSDSCTNINNMALVCDTLEKGLFGVELCMVRDRDGLTPEQIDTFNRKSKGRLIFLPYYHIENAFLHPKAIASVAQKILFSSAPTLEKIESKMLEYARSQLNHTASLYVKHEIYFQAGNFDISPQVSIDRSTTIQDIAGSMATKKDALLEEYSEKFSAANIERRLIFWKNTLENSLQNGWSQEARRFFIGKRMLKDLQGWIFGSKNILLWEHIVNSEDPACLDACKELRAIVDAM
ncbi:AAA family ATPase [Herbaspirillum sp.]|uniref:AAA family ATPase n=1 Tax=Herbaspirillum sp. TaxID=1890675 RepID=UPI0031E2E508